MAVTFDEKYESRSITRSNTGSSAEFKFVVRGTADEVRTIANRLISTTGVKHGKLVCSSTGEHI